MWKVLIKQVHFLEHVYTGYTQRQCETSKDIYIYIYILLTITESCSNPEFLQDVRKKLRALKNWVFLVGPTIWTIMPRNMWNDIVRWQKRLLNIFKKYQFHVLMIINSKKKDWNPCEKFVKCMLSNCSETLIFDTHWKTWYSMVSEQTSTINRKMDQSMWQTIIPFDLLHSSYMWLQTKLSCGKNCSTMQSGTTSRLRFYRGSWGFTIYVRWNTVRIRKSHICSNKLDVQETDMCVPQFIGIWSVWRILQLFLWTSDWGWMVHPHLIYGIWSS